ncbi:mucin-16-like [Myotis yumanensis]|uniref:mucin-16-like n=1 Tax=Myotis yumanensis TaxID=159337 RepID=UPI0038D0E343
MPVSSHVPTGDGATEVSGTEGMSSGGTFSSGPAHPTMSPDISTGMRGLSTSPVMTGAAEGTLTTPTGHPGATSPGTTPLDTWTTASSPGTHGAATQGFTRSAVTTPGSRGPEHVSRTRPPFEETSSSSSVQSAPGTASPSPVSPTIREGASSPPPPVTSVWTSGLQPATDALGTSVDPGARSTPHVSESTARSLDSTAASTGTGAVHLSGHIAETSVGTTRSGRETPSSGPGESAPTEVTSPVATPSVTRESRVSPPVPGSSETTWPETESASSTSPGPREASTSQPMSSAAETMPVSSHVPTGDGATEVSGTEGMSSGGTFSSGPAHPTMSPDISTGMRGLSTSPVMTGAAEGTLTTPTGHPGATSPGTTPLDTWTTASSPGTHGAATQGFTRSAVTTPGSRGPEHVSRTRPPFEETSSSSSVQSAPGTASPSPVSPTIREGASSPPPPVTSVWTSGLQPATDALGTSVDPGARSTPRVSESTARSLDSTAASTGTVAVHLSGHTAETSVGTTRSGRETPSSGPGESAPTEVTSPVATPSVTRESRVSPPVPGSSETTWPETESASSTSPGPREASTSQPMSSAAETMPVSSHVPTGDGATEVSGTEGMSSGGTFSSGPAHPTMSPDISTGMRGLSTSPVMTGAAEGTLTTPTGHPGATSPGTTPLDTWTTASSPGTHGAATQGFTRSAVTTPGSRGPEHVSRTRPPFEETSSSSSVQSAPGTASPSPVSPTIREGASSPPPPVTSVWTSGLQPATDALGTSVDPGARSTPRVSESTARSLDSTAASTGTGAVHLSGHTAETSVGTTRSGRETPSSGPGESAPTEVTSPVATPSVTRESRVSPPVPGSSETTWPETESASSTSPGPREASTSQPMSSAAETMPVSSHVPTGDGATEVSGTEGMSSGGTFSSGPAHPTMSPDISTGMRGLSTSPVMTGAAEGTLTTPTGHPGATSPGTTPLDTWTTASSPGTHGAATQGFTRSAVTTPGSRGPEHVSRTRPPFEETSSSSSVQSAPGTASPSPVSPTIREGASSPPPPVTSVWTSGLQPATDALGTSVDPGARSTPRVSESTARSLDSTAASTGTGAVHLSGHTAETSVGTTRHAGALDIPSHDRSRRGDPHHANWSPWGYVAGHNSLGHMDHRLQPRDSRGCDSRFHTLSGDDSREQGPGARVQDTSSL